MYNTTEEGKFKYELEANKTSFDYVAALYSSVKDSDIKVTDEDYLNYMKKHEKNIKKKTYFKAYEWLKRHDVYRDVFFVL